MNTLHEDEALRRSLWNIITVVAALMGFLMGYASAPMVESGLLGREGRRGATLEETKALEQYYRDLYKEQ